MPLLTVYTDPLRPGICQTPIFTVGDSQNWSLLFNDGSNFYNPTGVSMKIGCIKGLPDATYSNAFQWVDRMNNQHTGSFVISSGLPGSLTWDEAPIGFDGDSGAWLLSGRVPPSNGIRKVYVKYGGAGISTAPALRFRGGVNETGQGATATATLGGGGGSTITAITVTNRGRGYSATNPPSVIITGDGTGGKAHVTTTAGIDAAGGIIGITVDVAGTGYTAATVTIVDPEATATAAAGGTSSVTALNVVNSGSGYTSAPALAFSPASTTAATATLLNSTWGLKGLTITGAGSTYISAPTVSFTGGTGSGAAAMASVDYPADGIGVVTVLTPGDYATQYTQPPITITGGGGSGASGYAVMAWPNGWGFSPHIVDHIVITSPGSGYVTAPTITVPDMFGGTAGTFSCALGNGAITALTLTNPGSGYGATAPTVVFGSGAATATAQLIGSPISPALTITNAGSGYTAPPAVSFSGGGGTGATATAQVSLGITTVTMAQTGYAYTALPSISCIPDSGAVLIPAGIESHSFPFLQNFLPATAQGAISVTASTTGRRDTSGNLIYDNSLLIVRPRYVVQPALTLQADGLTWTSVFTPVNTFISAVLAYRRSFVADVEIFGGGRLLFTGSLTIAAA